MLSIHCFQFFLFSVCVHISTVFIYFVYYSDLISTKYIQDIKPEYDYVIVGSGTAGSVIAHRLATETNYTFIVVEAGCRSHALLEAPVLGPFFHGSLLDWQFQTVPQKHACFAMKDRKCKLAQGKILGGSSKLNNMIHIRGNISHYVNWFHGKHTMEYIEKQFEFIEQNILHLNDVQYQSDLADAVLGAAKELNYPTLDIDFKSGFRKNIVSQNNGKRWCTSDNLDVNKHVVTNAFVEKVIFKGNTAVGIKILLAGRQSSIYARKGVILSAGAINTPKILQLSGIGPQKLLKTIGIPAVKNLPVGENLQDHIGTGLDFVLFNKSVSISAMDMINPLYVLNYFINGKGPWTTPGCEVIGFLSTKNQSDPDLQFMVLPVGLSSDRGSLLRNNVNIRDEVWDKYFSKSFDSYVGTILPLILHPKSRGHVYINSTDPEAPPLVDPKYLSHESDRETLINGLKLVIQFVNTKSIQNIGGYINQNHFPGCEHFEIFTDSYFDCYIKHLTLTSYHPVGTCSMGLPDSNKSVVDTSFKVLGVEKLYVADASVLPTLPSGNINAAIAMMASVFFDTSIKVKIHIPFCYTNDLFKEYLFNVCFDR
ncbi:glucose dehydrogenase [FAD, quinone] [Helicoverpa armigera]|uniref:glucose dehydrogenase [FAD, quinone] n=1 Tax=Helicoverpa armigera TaxID=29058 RepID=UPI00308349F5